MEELYGVFKRGGSIGETNGLIIGNLSHDEALTRAKELRKRLTRGEREYYHISYTIRKMPKSKN